MYGPHYLSLGAIPNHIQTYVVFYSDIRSPRFEQSRQLYILPAERPSSETPSFWL